MYVKASTIDPAPSARTSSSAPARDNAGTVAPNVATAEALAVADKTADAHAVRSAVALINRAAKSLTNTVQLVMDERSERPIVKVVDSETGQLIRQIPNEEVLELRSALDRISGMLIHRTA